MKAKEQCEESNACCCEKIGLTTGKPVVEEIHNGHGQHYWKATANIESVFGSEVSGQVSGIGKTRKQAMDRLNDEITKLAESLWA